MSTVTASTCEERLPCYIKVKCAAFVCGIQLPMGRLYAPAIPWPCAGPVPAGDDAIFFVALLAERERCSHRVLLTRVRWSTRHILRRRVRNKNNVGNSSESTVFDFELISKVYMA